MALPGSAMPRRALRGPSDQTLFRVLVCVAHTLNVTGQPRVTLSPRYEQLRAARGPRQEEKRPEIQLVERAAKRCAESALRLTTSTRVMRRTWHTASTSNSACAQGQY